MEMTMPLWLVLLFMGIPTACLIMLVAGLLQAKRKQRKIRLSPLAKINLSPFGQQITHQAMTQQIDAVFNALVAVIETERIKLKTLMVHSMPDTSASEPTSNPLSVEEQWTTLDDEETTDLSQNVLTMATDGMSPEQIAKKLGLSHNEVALALKLRKGNERRRLEAIA